MDFNAILTGAAALGSLVAALMAGRSLRVSKKALHIAEENHEASQTQLSFYIIDSIKYFDKVKNEYSVTFALTVINKSSLSISLNSIDLHLYYVRDTGERNFLIFPQVYTSECRIKLEELNRLSTPLNIEPRNSVSGWAVFCFPLKSIEGSRIEKYKIVGTAIDDTRVSVESFIIRELIDEEGKDQ